jgi:integrase
MKNSSNRPNSKCEVKITIGHDPNGKAIRKSFYGRSKREAKQKAEQFKIDNTYNESFDSNITFKQLCEECLNEREKAVRPTTLNTYKTTAAIFIKEFGDMKASSITRKMISNYIDKIAVNYSATYLRIIVSNISYIFNFGCQNEYITVNPCQNIRYKSAKPKKEKSVYTEEEADLIIEYCQKREDGISVDLMLGYGLTKSETLGIQYSDIDFENRIISIRRGVTYGKDGAVVDDPKNKHRRRDVAVSAKTIEHIRKFEDRNYTYLVHEPGHYDEPYNPSRWYYASYKVCMDAMKYHYQDEGITIPALNPHELRHSRASIYMNKGINIAAICAQLGWSDPKMLMTVYGHPDIDLLRKLLEIDD